MSKTRIVTLALLGVIPFLSACASRYQSVKIDSNGDYVILGTVGPDSYVWTCSYDPATKTLTIKDKATD